MSFFSKINKFSLNVLKTIFISAVILIITGVFLIEDSVFFNQLYIARKTVETGFCFLPLSVGLAFLTDYLYKKNLS